jgi:hypothetical protein
MRAFTIFIFSLWSLFSFGQDQYTLEKVKTKVFNDTLWADSVANLNRDFQLYIKPKNIHLF